MTDYANEYFEKVYFFLYFLLPSLMSDWLQVRKETWVPSDLPDHLEVQEAQDCLVVPDLKVFTKTCCLNTSLITLHTDIIHSMSQVVQYLYITDFFLTFF